MDSSESSRKSSSLVSAPWKLEVVRKLTEKRQVRRLKRKELKLRKSLELRRFRRKKINRSYASRTGHHLTMKAFLRIKLMAGELEAIDKETFEALEKIKDIQATLEGRLKTRTEDISKGLVDPEGPTGKENERKARLWLAMVPELFKRHEVDTKLDVQVNQDLKKLTTVLNYIDEGNNQGAPDAVSTTVVEEEDNSSSDEDSDSEMSSDDGAMNYSDSDRSESSSDSDTNDSSDSDTDDE